MMLAKRPSRGPSIGPFSLLFSVLLLFATATNAATNLPNLSTITGSATSGSAEATSTGNTKSSAVKTTATSDSGSSTAPSTAAGSGTSASTVVVTSAPDLSSTASLSVFHLTGLPTISGALDPTIGVPDTANAPFMQKSNLPDGTVFICVGAALGFMGAAILAWRGLVAWSLHRSVKRAALAQNLADSKSLLHGPGGHRSLYTTVGASSTMSLDRLSAAPLKPFSSGGTGSGNNGGGGGAVGTPPKHTPSASSLFFSPTAGSGLHGSANRPSSYLPAGYYASGSAQPASGAQMTHVGGSGAPPSLLGLGGPASAGYQRTRSMGISPPGSPGLPPSRGNPFDQRPPPSRGESSIGYTRSSVAGTVGGGGGSGSGMYGHGVGSSSNLSLPGASAVAGGRAPSAYLEDLFENHGNGPRERF